MTTFQKWLPDETIKRVFTSVSVSNTIFLMWLLSATAAASNDVGVRAQSYGGAFRAVASSNDVIFYNPAGLIKNRRIGSDFDYMIDADAHHHKLGVSVIDSQTSAWGLGLAYNAGINSQSTLATTHLLYLAMAMPIVTDMFSLGTSYSYYYDSSAAKEPFRHFFNLDLALMAQLPAGVSFAVVADHLLKPKGSEKSLGLSLASAFNFGKVFEEVPLTVSFDWLMDDVASEGDLGHIIGCGAEYIAFSMLPVRLGFKSDFTEKLKFLSMGTGIVAGRFAIDGLYQQHLAIGKLRHFGIALRVAM